MDKLKADFEAISSHGTLREFVEKYGLADVPASETMILSIYEGKYNGTDIKLIHRWYDRSSPFDNAPDGNEITLELRGNAGRASSAWSVKYNEN